MDEVFRRAERSEVLIYVPIIVLAECTYLVERKRISLSVNDLFSKFRVSGNFLVAPLTPEVVEEATRVVRCCADN